MKRTFLVFALLAATGFTACDKKCDDRILPVPGGNRNGNGIAPGGCYPVPNCNDVICTADFRQEHLTVQNASGAPVTLDSFVVTDASGTALPKNAYGLDVYGYPFDGSNGQYTVINDAWVQGHQNSTAAIRAKGFVNGSMVFDEPYTVMTDCCHIDVTSGKNLITVNSN